MISPWKRWKQRKIRRENEAKHERVHHTIWREARLKAEERLRNERV